MSVSAGAGAQTMVIPADTARGHFPLGTVLDSGKYGYVGVRTPQGVSQLQDHTARVVELLTKYFGPPSGFVPTTTPLQATPLFLPTIYEAFTGPRPVLAFFIQRHIACIQQTGELASKGEGVAGYGKIQISDVSMEKNISDTASNQVHFDILGCCKLRKGYKNIGIRGMLS